MKNGDVVLCLDIIENTGDPFAPFICGHAFKRKKHVWEDTFSNSSDIGFYIVSVIDYENEKRWLSSEVVSKCFISPYWKDFDFDKKNHDPFSHHFSEAFKKGNVGGYEFTDFLRRRSCNKWHVFSMELPS